MKKKYKRKHYYMRVERDFGDICRFYDAITSRIVFDKRFNKYFLTKTYDEDFLKAIYIYATKYIYVSHYTKKEHYKHPVFLDD